jgi:O-antigen/teichoic acid export membrane protein
MTEMQTRAISSRLLTRNVLWSLLGTGLPMLVAVFVIPVLLEQMGVARFGVLSLAWIVVGYFSLFDLGLGRVMTQLVARELGSGQYDQIPPLVWAGLVLMGVMGIVGAVVLAVLSPWLVGQILEIPQELQAETVIAFFLLAASIPVVISTTGLRGVLEAHQRFDLVNIVRVPLGFITYLGPLAVLPFSHRLPAMVAVLVIARLISWATYFGLCLQQYPNLRERQTLQTGLMKRMLSFGGWMTLSNIAAPLLLYLGRFQLAVLVSAEAVAYFSVPYDLVTNLLIIPGVLVSVFFPAFAQQFRGVAVDVSSLYRRSMRYMLGIMLPLALVPALFARPGLAWWINEEFADNGYRAAQILAIGVLVNSFGHLSQAVVQAYGRPDLTAKLHLAELVLYVPYSWWLINHYGIEGAALAWVLRVFISTTVLAVMANRCIANIVTSRY